MSGSGVGLPREILRWLQSLDLSYPIAHPRRDFANGYLIAEILSRYWSKDVISLHSVVTGASTDSMASNWKVLTKAFTQKGFTIDPQIIQRVQQADQESCNHLVEAVYTSLTKRQVRKAPPLEAGEVAKPDYTHTYAAPTTSQLMRDVPPGKDKAQVLKEHDEHLKQEKRNRPLFQTKPKILAKAAAPKAPSGPQQGNVQFKEVAVKSLDNMSIAALRSKGKIKPHPPASAAEGEASEEGSGTGEASAEWEGGRSASSPRAPVVDHQAIYNRLILGLDDTSPAVRSTSLSQLTDFVNSTEGFGVVPRGVLDQLRFTLEDCYRSRVTGWGCVGASAVHLVIAILNGRQDVGNTGLVGLPAPGSDHLREVRREAKGLGQMLLAQRLPPSVRDSVEELRSAVNGQEGWGQEQEQEQEGGDDDASAGVEDTWAG